MSPVIHPEACPECGNRTLARYGQVSRCACGWSNQPLVTVQPASSAAGAGNRFWSWFARWYVHLFVRLDHRTKCPACGTRRRHPYRFRPEYRQVIHTCADCRARWGEAPVVEATTWLVVPPEKTAAPEGRKP